MRKVPTRTKEKRGTLEKSRAMPNEVEYTPLTSCPHPPARLDEVGQQVWNLSAHELFDKGLLFNTDLWALEAYCEAVSNSLTAQRKYRENGAEQVTKSYVKTIKKFIKDEEEGWKVDWVDIYEFKVNPWFKVWKDSLEVVNRFGAKFGFSPVDKMNIAIPAPKGGQPGSLLK